MRIFGLLRRLKARWRLHRMEWNGMHRPLEPPKGYEHYYTKEAVFPGMARKWHKKTSLNDYVNGFKKAWKVYRHDFVYDPEIAKMEEEFGTREQKEAARIASAAIEKASRSVKDGLHAADEVIDKIHDKTPDAKRLLKNRVGILVEAVNEFSQGYRDGVDGKVEFWDDGKDEENIDGRQGEESSASDEDGKDQVPLNDFRYHASSSAFSYQCHWNAQERNGTQKTEHKAAPCEIAAVSFSKVMSRVIRVKSLRILLCAVGTLLVSIYYCFTNRDKSIIYEGRFQSLCRNCMDSCDSSCNACSENWSHGNEFHYRDSDVLPAWKSLIDNCAGKFEQGNLANALESCEFIAKCGFCENFSFNSGSKLRVLRFESGEEHLGVCLVALLQKKCSQEGYDAAPSRKRPEKLCEVISRVAEKEEDQQSCTSVGDLCVSNRLEQIPEDGAELGRGSE